MTCCQQALHKGFSGYIIGLQQEELFDICFLWLAFFGSKQCPSSQKKRATVHPGGYTSHLSWLPDALHFNDTVQTLPAFCFTTIHLFAGLALSLSPFRERQCSKYMHLSFFSFLEHRSGCHTVVTCRGSHPAMACIRSLNIPFSPHLPMTDYW